MTHHDRTAPEPRAVPRCAAGCTAWRTGSGATRRTRACWCACTACRARGATSTRSRARMVDRYRVVCPDVVGRGQSDWLPTRWATCAAATWPTWSRCWRAWTPSQVHWVGTSMGGLIGARRRRAGRLAGAPAGAQRRRPVDPGAGAGAHRHLPRPAVCVGRRSTRRPTTCWTISQGFGPHTREQWLALDAADGARATAAASCRTTTRTSRVPFSAITPEIAAAGEAALWQRLRPLALPDAAAARRRVRSAGARHRRRR